MRAGEHDRVGAPAAGIDEARRNLARDQIIRNRRPIELLLRETREPRRADQRDIAAVGEVADERTGIFAADGGLRAEHRHALGARDRAGRLDRRHGADERHAKARAQMRQHQRRGGVAGDDDQVGPVRLDQLAHEVADARHKLRLAVAAVRKEGVIGDVKVTRARPRLGDFAENGQSAETGIEDENGRCHGGYRYEKNLATLSTDRERGHSFLWPARPAFGQQLRLGTTIACSAQGVPNTRSKIVSTCLK
jgi:hypothetical protein